MLEAVKPVGVGQEGGSKPTVTIVVVEHNVKGSIAVTLYVPGVKPEITPLGASTGIPFKEYMYIGGLTRILPSLQVGQVAFWPEAVNWGGAKTSTYT
jgi:hypothetical protein